MQITEQHDNKCTQHNLFERMMVIASLGWVKQKVPIIELGMFIVINRVYQAWPQHVPIEPSLPQLGRVTIAARMFVRFASAL
jgi:hypothetical protein